MAYALSYRGIDGQAGLYARIQRFFDGMWWDEVTASWVAVESADCDVALAESLTEPGDYSASAGMMPAKGGIYVVSVYTAAGLLLIRNECPYLSGRLTVLQIINNVQKEMRLPQTGEVAFPTSAHAQLLLGFLNKTMDLMMEIAPSPNLKINGAFQTVAGIRFYLIAPVNYASGIDTLTRLQIGTYEPLVMMTDEQMSNYRRTSSTQRQPLYYRIHSRQGGYLIIELADTPDASYTVEFDGLMKVSKLTAHTDIPLLDTDTIQLGVLWMAKNDQGEEFQIDLEAFQAKVSLQNPNGGVAGDVDFI